LKEYGVGNPHRKAKKTSTYLRILALQKLIKH